MEESLPHADLMRSDQLATAIITGTATKHLLFPKLLPDHHLDPLLPDAPALSPGSSSYVNRGLCEMSWLLGSTYRGIQVEDH